MSAYDISREGFGREGFSMEGFAARRRRRGAPVEADVTGTDCGPEAEDRRGGRRGRWMREADESHGHHGHQHPYAHGHGRGGRGGGPFGAFGPGGEGFGPEFGFGPGPRGRGRGRSRAGRGDVRAAILALLAEEPRNGYQIIQEIEQRTGGVWRVSPGSVYPALSQLEDEGLIEPVGERGRKVFTLTAQGGTYAAANADQLARIWQDATGGIDPRFEETMRHREMIGQVAMAYGQVMQVGTAAQQEEARSVLVKARQALYKILAADEEPSGPQDSV
jgi:DNA-binding PadR family transcriptional regulator